MLSIIQIDLTRQFKKELKLEANALRVLKQDMKFAQSNRKPAGHLQSNVHTARVNIRHRHLAYCLLRGKSRKQCERIVRKGNEPNMDLVNSIMSKYMDHVKTEETVPVAA